MASSDEENQETTYTKKHEFAEFWFHENHGRNIVLSDNYQTAERKKKEEGHVDTDIGGVVMSRDPMEVNKMYQVKKYSDKAWVRVGVVTSPPCDVDVGEKASQLKTAVVICGEVVYDHGKEIPSSVGRATTHSHLKGSTMGLSVDCNQRLYFHCNGRCQGSVPCRPLPPRCHAMFELRSPEAKITVTTSEVNSAQEVKNTVPSNGQHTARREGVPTDSEVKRPYEPSAFCFHDNHGLNTLLSNGNQTARRHGVWTDGGGVVMSRDPMEINKLYEVVLHGMKRRARWSLAAGVVTSTPDCLTPPHVAVGWKEAVAVYGDLVADRGIETKTQLGQALKDLPLDSHVGVSVDVSRRLHLYLNGQHQGVVPLRSRDSLHDKEVASPDSLPDPCYVMFELRHSYVTITSLPVKELEVT